MRTKCSPTRVCSDGAGCFTRSCVSGIEANVTRIDDLMKSSLMLVTALNPHIGYDKASQVEPTDDTWKTRQIDRAYRAPPLLLQVAKKAHKEGTTLIEAGGPAGLGFFTPEEFAAWVKPEEMVSPTPR